MHRIKKHSHIDDNDDLIEYLKTADSTTLSKIGPFYTLPPSWAPTIENPNAIQPFLTKTPTEIYESNPPIKDVMFSFASRVHLRNSAFLTYEKMELIKKTFDSEIYINF